MKIKHITQAPFGTIVSLDGDVPETGVVRTFLTTDNHVFHKVKGTPTDIWTEVLIDKTETLTVGQEVNFVDIA